MAYRPEYFEKPPDLTPAEEQEVLKDVRDEFMNIRIRHDIIKPSVKNYDPEETYVIYDKAHIFVYNGELHRARLAKKQVKTFYISKPDRHL